MVCTTEEPAAYGADSSSLTRASLQKRREESMTKGERERLLCVLHIMPLFASKQPVLSVRSDARFGYDLLAQERTNSSEWSGC